MLIRRIARPLLSVAFIGQGVDALRNPKPAADAARPALEGMRKLPDPVGTNLPSDAETFARINAAVQVGGGLLLATGKLPRLASAALAFTVIPGSLGGHMSGPRSIPSATPTNRRAFMTDLSLLGGLIIAAVDTEGKPSLRWRGRRAARKVSEAVTARCRSGPHRAGALADSAQLPRDWATAAGGRGPRARVRARRPRTRCGTGGGRPRTRTRARRDSTRTRRRTAHLARERAADWPR